MPRVQSEKTPGLHIQPGQPDSGLSTPGATNNAHVDHAKARLRHFIHPDGRKIHVAHSPEEALSLGKTISAVHQDHEYEIYLAGSQEHLDALRKTHAYHKLRKEELREKHPHVFQVFEDVQSELDALSHELERVAVHGVSLGAHFSKFGYNAKIRSFDDGSPSLSGTSTPRSGWRSSRSSIARSNSNGGESSQSSVERGFATTLKLFKTPVVRQYWHKDILWRGSSSQEIQSFELFIDLLYVGILALVGDSAAESPDGRSLVQFAITFILSWKIWSDIELTISWFETDDVAQRISILVLLAILFGLTTNITRAFESTYPTFMGFYLAARLFNASYLVIVAVLVPMVRAIMVTTVALTIVSSGLLVLSIYVDYPLRLVPLIVGLFVEQLTRFVFLLLSTGLKRLGPKARAWAERAFEVVPAINIEHRTERMNAFVTLVFGYMVVSQLYQSTRNGFDAHYGKAVLGLTQAFCFNWMYFEVDNCNLHLHAIRRSAVATMVWSMAHLVFVMGFTLSAGALARLVLAHDDPHSGFFELSLRYQAASEDDIATGIRWFYCGGLGISLACMGLISLAHDHIVIPTVRLSKRWRLTGRFAVAITIVCLSLATSLNSLQLVATVTALIIFALCLELWATSCCDSSLFSRSKPCQYEGFCAKKDLRRLVREGGDEVEIDELLRKGRPAGVVGVM